MLAVSNLAFHCVYLFRDFDRIRIWRDIFRLRRLCRLLSIGRESARAVNLIMMRPVKCSPVNLFEIPKMKSMRSTNSNVRRKRQLRQFRVIFVFVFLAPEQEESRSRAAQVVGSERYLEWERWVRNKEEEAARIRIGTSYFGIPVRPLPASLASAAMTSRRIGLFH